MVETGRVRDRDSSAGSNASVGLTEWVSPAVTAGYESARRRGGGEADEFEAGSGLRDVRLFGACCCFLQIRSFPAKSSEGGIRRRRTAHVVSEL